MDELLTVGRYGTDECLASSDLGAVFRGYDPALRRPVAIKVLRSELSKVGPDGLHDKFKRRVRAACELLHPNIPTTFDFGEDNQISFIVMEDIDGCSLHQLLTTSGPFTPQRAVAILLQILDALKYSYEKRVLHLDLNTSMIFVTKTDQIKIADFGVALVNASDPTSIGEILPKTSSIAPEQLIGAPVDHRTDIFAAGALLFEMLTCAKPFRGRTVAETLRQMEIGMPEDVCALNPKVPHALRSVIEMALTYHPARRFVTAGAFSDAIGEAISLEDEAEIATRSLSPSTRGHEPPVGKHRWDPDILHRLEADLAVHIGPIAAIAVKRAADRANGLISLYEELSVHIKDLKERGEFLASAPCLTAATSSRIAVMRPDDRATNSMARRSQLLDPPDPAVLNLIEAKLSEYLGPIARILIEQRLQNFRGLSDLCRDLADHISDESERTAFLNLG